MKNKSFNGVKLLFVVFMFVSVVLPLLTLMTNIHINDLLAIVKTPQFVNMIINSLVTTTIATILSVGLAWVLAWCVNRTGIYYKTIISVLFTLPMLIPSISHGMGLVLLFGDNGLITNFLGINIGLYGYKGIIVGAILYSFPVAFLLLTDAFKYEDYTVYEAAKVLGLSKRQQFFTITLGNFKSTIFSTIFAVFTMIFTDYGVPLVVGGKILTIPVYMYREVVGLLDFSKGAIIGLVLLIPAFIEFIFDLRSEETSNVSTVTKEFVISQNKTRDRIAYIICVIVLVGISIPLLSFGYLSIVKQYPINMSLSLDNVVQAFDIGVGSYLLNSLTIALTTALVGVMVIYVVAYITARSKKTFSSMALHLISLITLAIPGIVLGLSYIVSFKNSPIYGTLAILIMVNIVHFFASPYLLAYNSLNKFNEKLEDVASVMGISKLRMILDVYVPCTMESIVEMFSYLFVNSMVTISAVSFLANFKNMPLALMIPQFDSQSLIEATAFISVVILVVNGIVKLLVYALKKYIRKNQAF